MDILFWVVVAAVWAIGGIVKAAGSKRKGQKRPPGSPKPARQESFLERLAKKAEELQHAAERQGKQGAERPGRMDSQGRQQRPAEPPPQAAPGQVTVRTGRGGQPVLVYERQRSPSAAPRERSTPPRSEPEQRRMPKPATELTPRQTPVVSPVSEDIPSRRPLTPKPNAAIRAGDSLLVDYSDPGALRRAILQMEILGKPLALREPFD